jgi:hypothetical protein
MSEPAKIGDIESEPVNMHQALSVAANMCASFIGQMQPVALELSSDDEKRAYQQAAVSILIYQIVALSKHKATMAKILRLVADEMEEQAAAEVGL